LTRYVAFLRGVSPQNAKMPALKASFEAAGFSNVRTILGSGNVAFDARTASIEAIAQRAEKAMQSRLGRTFATIVRPARHLQDLVASNPFTDFDIPKEAKRVVTFLRRPAEAVQLPIERDGAAILAVAGSEAFTTYLPSDKGPVFMVLLERTFGTEITTRTLDTVAKCAVA
jgi:uncharacterized protein (DUF1697 family)